MWIILVNHQHLVCVCKDDQQYDMCVCLKIVIHFQVAIRIGIIGGLTDEMGHDPHPQRKAIAETRFHTVLTWFMIIPSQPPPHVVTMPKRPFSGKQVQNCHEVSQVGSSQGRSIPSNKKSLGNSMIFLLPWKMSLKLPFCFSIWRFLLDFWKDVLFCAFSPFSIPGGFPVGKSMQLLQSIIALGFSQLRSSRVARSVSLHFLRCPDQHKGRAAWMFWMRKLLHRQNAHILSYLSLSIYICKY